MELPTFEHTDESHVIEKTSIRRWMFLHPQGGLTKRGDELKNVVVLNIIQQFDA